MKKSSYARIVAAMLKRTSSESFGLAEGMWNPQFCSSDAGADIKTFVDEMQEYLDRLKPFANLPSGD